MDRSDTRPFGHLFGYPLAHSLSPLLHQTVFQEEKLERRYTPLESTDVKAFLNLLQDPKCYGSAVTMPHKVAICSYLDELTPEGRDVGACNTIFFKQVDGKRTSVGTNTDVIGVREAFLRNVQNAGEVFYHKPALVVGGGGAARSAVYALTKWLKCSEIYIVNRDEAEVRAVMAACKAYTPGMIHVRSVEQAEQLEGPGAIVGCIPDLPPTSIGELEARKVVEIMLAKPHKGAILEMAYHPKRWTALAKLAKAAGWQVVLGVEAMIWQGLEQARLWAEFHDIESLPVERVRRAIAFELARSDHCKEDE